MSWGLTGSPRFRRCNPICNPTRHNRPLLGDISRNETQENVLVSGTEETPTTPAVMAATDFRFLCPKGRGGSSPPSPTVKVQVRRGAGALQGPIFYPTSTRALAQPVRQGGFARCRRQPVMRRCATGRRCRRCGTERQPRQTVPVRPMRPATHQCSYRLPSLSAPPPASALIAACERPPGGSRRSRFGWRRCVCPCAPLMESSKAASVVWVLSASRRLRRPPAVGYVTQPRRRLRRLRPDRNPGEQTRGRPERRCHD